MRRLTKVYVTLAIKAPTKISKQIPHFERIMENFDFLSYEMLFIRPKGLH